MARKHLPKKVYDILGDWACMIAAYENDKLSLEELNKLEMIFKNQLKEFGISLIDNKQALNFRNARLSLRRNEFDVLRRYPHFNPCYWIKHFDEWKQELLQQS